jgi:hypothetical protein
MQGTTMEPDETDVLWDEITGGKELRAWFGQIPSFHDAEVIDLVLGPRGQSIIRVRVWLVKTNAEGFPFKEKEAVVRFILEDVTDLELLDFKSQNVIDGLVLSRAPAGFELLLQPCYGLYGRLRARKLSVDFKTGNTGMASPAFLDSSASPA